MWWKSPQHPYIGEYKEINSESSDKPVDEYEIIALAKRVGISLDDMRRMSFVSLMNILISSVHKDDGVRQATQEDIDRTFG